MRARSAQFFWRMELSERVMGMKFMQRKAERERRKSLESNKEKEAQWGAEQTLSPFIMLAELQMDPSDKVRPLPRMSFKKFNPAVEKMQQEFRIKHAAKKRKTSDGNDPSISKEEMAKRLGKIRRGETLSEDDENDSSEDDDEHIKESNRFD